MYWRKISLLLTLILVFLLSYNNLQSQNVSAVARLDTTKALIGDWVKLKLEVNTDKPTSIVWPQIPDSVGKLEFIAKSKIDTVKSDKGIKLTQTLTLTSFDSGVYIVPSFVFMYEKSGFASLFPVSTDSFFVTFRTVPVDTSKAIKDIKPVMDVPFSLDEYLPTIAIILGIILLALLGYYLWKRFKRKPEEVPAYDPKIPPHVIALMELEKLENEKLWQKGQIKLYYIKLTEIIRTYIERRFSIAALEMVTDEIVAGMEAMKMEPFIIQTLRTVFKRADLVKFAKYQPLPDENSLSMSESAKFVNNTIIRESITENSQNEEKNN